MTPVVGLTVAHLQLSYDHLYCSGFTLKTNSTAKVNIILALTYRLYMVFFPSDLQGSITRIHRTIELMYSDKSMMQVSSTFL